MATLPTPYKLPPVELETDQRTINSKLTTIESLTESLFENIETLAHVLHGDDVMTDKLFKETSSVSDRLARILEDLSTANNIADSIVKRL